ncbi:hypothetical protein DTO045G8_8847 [Paecilomyces variotii]|nr:hypothetical protein DTO045G8_8847 [Paecilomyces variotii]
MHDAGASEAGLGQIISTQPIHDVKQYRRSSVASRTTSRWTKTKKSNQVGCKTEDAPQSRRDAELLWQFRAKRPNWNWCSDGPEREEAKATKTFDRFVRDPLRVGYRKVREARMAGKGALSGPPALLEVFITGKTSDL